MKRNGIAARISAVILAASMVMADVVPISAAVADDAAVPAFAEEGLDTEPEEVWKEGMEGETESLIPEEEAVGEVEAEGGDVESTGTAGTPAKVTGLKVSGNYLTWDSQEMTAYGYDIMATSQTGIKFYSYNGKNAAGDWQDGFDSPTSHGRIIWANVFSLNTGLSTTADATYMTPGTKYQYQVRAVNRVSAKNALGNTTYTYAYGPWSSAVSFTLPAYSKLTKVTVNTEQSGSDYLYLNLGQAVDWYNLYASVYTDAACANRLKQQSEWDDYEYPATLDGSLEYGNTVARFDIGDKGLVSGVTYYIRLYNSNTYYGSDQELELAGNVRYSNVVAFKVPEVAAVVENAPATTITSVVNADKTGVTLNASSAKLMENYQNNHYVRYEYSTDNINWYYLDEQGGLDGISVSYSRLAGITGAPGKAVYIRARAYVSGVPGTVSNVLTLMSPAITKISGLTYEQTEEGYELRYSGNVNTGCESVVYEYSTSKSFTKNYSTVYENQTTKTTDGSLLSYGQLVPGKTYYVRAFVESDYYSDNDTINGRQYSAYTNVLTLKASVPDITIYATVSSKSVKLSMDYVSNSKGPVTGYQIARKSGKTYEELIKTTDDVYTDSGRASDTSYTYRVRAYYYNPSTKKSYYGAWAYASATTWGSSLELKAAAASATSVKLSWNKVTGANGYEIYRYVGDGASVDTKGTGSFSKKQLVKTIKKTATKTYTDKGLTAGVSYTYVVRAYRVQNGKTYYIDEAAEVKLGLSSVVITKQTQSAKTGKTTVTWNKVAAAKGYLIEKYDDVTRTWKTTKKISKNTTVKYTFPAVTGTDISATYRIRAYNGKKYSAAKEINIYRSIAVAGTVKAKASAKNGTITVSWKKVSGADYYKVYRTTSSWSLKDAVTGTIGSVAGLKNLYSYTQDTVYPGNYTESSYVTTTSYVDKKVSYTNKFGEEVVVAEGPQAGVKYYYYVLAYKIVDEDYNAAQAAKDEIPLTNYTSVSSYGYSKAASATVTSAKVSKAAIKSVKSSKKNQVTVTIKKKISGATSYLVYRSTKKASGYSRVGTTTKLTYTDKTAKSGNTYYYKVKVVSGNEAGATIYSALSSASKAVKTK